MSKEKEKLLELRRKIKSRKPNFSRQSAHKKDSLGDMWRRPKGLHSKLRLKKAGHKKKVSKGYGSPNSVRGLSSQGFKTVLVSDSNVVGKINPSEYCIIISSTVGLRKKMEILKEAISKKIKIMNFKNPEAYLKKAEDDIKKKKEEKSQKTEAKKKKKEELKKKADEKEKKLEEELSDDEKKENEKKDKDKLLTKKT